MSAEPALLGWRPEFSLLFGFQNANKTLEQNSLLSQGLPTALFYIFPALPSIIVVVVVVIIPTNKFNRRVQAEPANGPIVAQAVLGLLCVVAGKKLRLPNLVIIEFVQIKRAGRVETGAFDIHVR